MGYKYHIVDEKYHVVGYKYHVVGNKYHDVGYKYHVVSKKYHVVGYIYHVVGDKYHVVGHKYHVVGYKYHVVDYKYHVQTSLTNITNIIIKAIANHIKGQQAYTKLLTQNKRSTFSKHSLLQNGVNKRNKVGSVVEYQHITTPLVCSKSL